MKRTGIFLGLFVFFLPVSAQTLGDSLAIAGTEWKVKRIKKGLVWKQSHYSELFGGQQEINILEADLRKGRSKLSFRGSGDSLMISSKWLRKATAGINGSFFDTKNGGGTTLLKIDGKLVDSTTLKDTHGRNTERANGALILDGKSTRIIPGDIRIKNWDRQIEAMNVLVSGPVLLLDSVIVPLSKSSFNTKKHPRSVVAISTDNKLILAVVDGRNAQSAGMTLPELSYFLRLYGARDALNLDGGGSSTLYVKGAGTNGVVNHPTDNGRFDHLGERKVANVIVIE